MNRREWEVCKVAHAPFPTEQGMGDVISMASEKPLSRITLVELTNACFYLCGESIPHMYALSLL